MIAAAAAAAHWGFVQTKDNFVPATFENGSLLEICKPKVFLHIFHVFHFLLTFLVRSESPTQALKTSPTGWVRRPRTSSLLISSLLPFTLLLSPPSPPAPPLLLSLLPLLSLLHLFPLLPICSFRCVRFFSCPHTSFLSVSPPPLSSPLPLIRSLMGISGNPNSMKLEERLAVRYGSWARNKFHCCCRL